MALQEKVLYSKDSVYIHINVSTTEKEDAYIPGTIRLLQKPEGHFIEWTAEETTPSSEADQEWDVVGDISSKQASGNSETSACRKHNISFDLVNLKSFKCNAPNDGWVCVVFVLKDGTTFPALHFHDGGSSALMKEMERFLNVHRSVDDAQLYTIQEHDPDMLTRSFDELQVFNETSGQLVSNFINDPYSTALSSFSRVTHFLRDVLLLDDPESQPRGDLDDLLQHNLSGMEVNTQDEPGFELVTKTSLSPRLETRRGEPVSEAQWMSYFDADGCIQCAEQVKHDIFRGGVDASIRGEVWKYLLGYYPWDSTPQQRQAERKKKIGDYFRMKQQWKTVSHEQERRFSTLRDRKAIIEKDVARTDRVIQFYSGADNPNLQVLYDILMTYCMYNFDLGYVQGMSDLLSPLLVVMENEVDTFWCFAGLMERMCHNFELDQGGMKQQLSHLQTLMQIYDPQFYAYLEKQDSGNFFFCFRWILILFKREFPFEEIPRLWEVMWTDLPCQNFHLIFALAILDSERSTLVDNQFGFTEIIKHINDAPNTIALDKTLNRAEAMCRQLMDCHKLPHAAQLILGLLPPSPSRTSRPSSSSSPVSTSPSFSSSTSNSPSSSPSSPPPSSFSPSSSSSTSRPHSSSPPLSTSPSSSPPTSTSTSLPPSSSSPKSSPSTSPSSSSPLSLPPTSFPPSSPHSSSSPPFPAAKCEEITSTDSTLLSSRNADMSVASHSLPSQSQKSEVTAKQMNFLASKTPECLASQTEEAEWHALQNVEIMVKDTNALTSQDLRPVLTPEVIVTNISDNSSSCSSMSDDDEDDIEIIDNSFESLMFLVD